MKFDSEKVRALFLLAGFEVEEIFETANQYWPKVADYADLREESPWFLVRTEFGLIHVGWRKRVFQIDWKDTAFRATDEIKITDDDVTKTDTIVHAWNYPNALTYLTCLRVRLSERPLREATVDNS